MEILERPAARHKESGGKSEHCRGLGHKRDACGRFVGNIIYVAHIKIKARHCERSEAECGNLPPEASISLKPSGKRKHIAR